MQNSKKSIFFDYNSTTPCDPDVLKDMLPYFSEIFGNAGSTTHAFGWEASDAVEKARKQVADGILCQSKSIIFTSGATEANNIAIKGSMQYLKSALNKNHIITLVTEHKCVLESCSDLEQEGFNVTYLPVQKNGLVDLNKLKNAICSKTGLVSIAWVHNEIGVIQNIPEISKICRQNGVLLHTDAAQALGKIKVDSKYVDLMSLSGHKIYGPKGIGALYVKPKVRLVPIFSGGGQERGIRSGTLPVALCVGMGKACEIASNSLKSEFKRIRKFYNYMSKKVLESLPLCYINGCTINRVPHNLNFSFGGVEGESIMMYMDDIAVSSGSACTSKSLEPSYVISALGVEDELVHSAIRICFGRQTKFEEVKYATKRLIEAVKSLRKISPLWEMREAGIDISQIKWMSH